jgi:YHS domain-containing protein
MKKTYLVIMGLGVLVLGINQLAQAQNKVAEPKTTATVSTPQDVGNKICPVTGEKIDEKTKATYEYNGKIYNFCCPMCIDEFKKDPQKYIKKVEEELHADSKTGTKSGKSTK